MRLKQITPFVPCTSIEQQIAFYTEVLDFTVRYNAENYAFLTWDDIAVRLIEVDSDVDLSVPERENSFYIDVVDIDAVYASLQARLATLPEGRVRAPFDQEYGQREFHVIDEDCTLIFFGEAIKD